MAAPDSGGGITPIQVFLASSNLGKLREYRELARGSTLELDSLPAFREITLFDESAPTFAENGAGKALYYSKFTDELVLAEDSGLVVPALGGAPGVHSARYAGWNGTDSDCVRKLLQAMQGKSGDERRARFVCVTSVARRGRAVLVVSDFVPGVIASEPRGENGFGYDPVFFLPELGRTSAEISTEEKNRVSHRAKAFRKVTALLTSTNFPGTSLGPPASNSGRMK